LNKQTSNNIGVTISIKHYANFLGISLDRIDEFKREDGAKEARDMEEFHSKRGSILVQNHCH
jgi:hypothetical protein